MSREDMAVLNERIEAAVAKEKAEKRKQMKKEMKAKKDSFFKDFRKFITKGNVLDLAVAVVIGTAFNAITNGLVKFIINPFISLLTGGISLDGWKTVLEESYTNEAGTVVPEVAILWGEWIQTIIQFFIIALSIFIVVRFIRRAEKVMYAKELERKAAEEAQKKEEDKKKAEAEAAASAQKEAQLQDFYAQIARQTALLESLAGKESKQA